MPCGETHQRCHPPNRSFRANAQHSRTPAGKLSNFEPDALLLTPRPFQHISFNQVVYWGGQYKLGHDQTWTTIEQKFH